jgi:hypothetical protein
VAGAGGGAVVRTVCGDGAAVVGDGDGVIWAALVAAVGVALGDGLSFALLAGAQPPMNIKSAIAPSPARALGARTHNPHGAGRPGALSDMPDIMAGVNLMQTFNWEIRLTIFPGVSEFMDDLGIY